jgi:hypothetical protein
MVAGYAGAIFSQNSKRSGQCRSRVYPELYPPVDPFLSGLEDLIAGSGQSHALSFLDRAKATWSERTGKTKT